MTEHDIITLAASQIVAGAAAAATHKLTQDDVQWAVELAISVRSEAAMQLRAYHRGSAEADRIVNEARALAGLYRRPRD